MMPIERVVARTLAARFSSSGLKGHALLREFSQPGGVVLDPFCGSGAVPAAAVALGRVGVGCELDPAAAADAQRALSAAQLLMTERALR
jgi:DNA modification methylase